MSDDSSSKGVKSSLSVLGAIVTIVSIWWFALRPMSKKRDH
jgi:hypothetical protein